MPSPVNTSLPTVTGAPVVGQLMLGTTGAWSNSPTGYAFQWIYADNLANISGAVYDNYTPVTGDIGHTLALSVTATNGSGSTTATSAATNAVIASPGNVQTLSSLRFRARIAGDVVNDAHISDVEVNQWINNGMAELHDLLVEAYDEVLTIVTGTGTGDIPIVANAASYALPTNFYKMMGVDYLFGMRPFQFTMTRFQPRERNRYQGPFAPLITGRLIAGILVPQYRVRNQFIDVIPLPTQQMGLGTMRLSYVKQFAYLVNDTDLVDASIPNGWEEYAVLRAAATALAKQERDPSIHLGAMQQIKASIQAMADNRDAGEPQRIVDVNRLW